METQAATQYQKEAHTLFLIPPFLAHFYSFLDTMALNAFEISNQKYVVEPAKTYHILVRGDLAELILCQQHEDIKTYTFNRETMVFGTNKGEVTVDEFYEVFTTYYRQSLTDLERDKAELLEGVSS